MDARWVKIRSWHIIHTERILNVHKTMCGKYALGPVLETRPPADKSCESCLRIYTKAA